MTLKELPENAVKVSTDETILGQEKVEENAPALLPVLMRI
jgi:hypothetical protein